MRTVSPTTCHCDSDSLPRSHSSLAPAVQRSAGESPKVEGNVLCCMRKSCFAAAVNMPVYTEANLEEEVLHG